MESVVIVKKSQVFADEAAGDCSSDSGGPFDEPLPEIEARFCERNVLLRVHCEKRTGLIEKTMSEIEKLHLIITSSSVMTFGSSALDITIIAQVINSNATKNEFGLSKSWSSVLDQTITIEGRK